MATPTTGSSVSRTRSRHGLEGVGAVLRHGTVLVAVVCGPSGSGCARPDHPEGDGAQRRAVRRRQLVLLRRLHHREPALGIHSRLRRPARRHADGRRHLDRRQRVARLDDGVDGVCDVSRSARLRRRRHVSGRPEDGRRVVARQQARAGDRVVVQRRHARRRGRAVHRRAYRAGIRVAKQHSCSPVLSAWRGWRCGLSSPGRRFCQRPSTRSARSRGPIRSNDGSGRSSSAMRCRPSLRARF